MITETLGDEVVIVAYDYNGRQPRFFSKYFAAMNPGVYDTMIRVAVGGSAAAPTYFDPMTYIDHYNITERLIDGGVIANNPSNYAYNIARLKGKSDIRLLSIGTGEKEYKGIDHVEALNKVAYALRVDDFMMVMDIEA